ncbi:Glycosyltransferase-like protein [Prochlorococcus marinus str. MIT 9312]|uniref:Glycosyltransferase-like protein n=1 Tax=Prochlorococcus marinus (strain MIT 9312) TaxID=74546 RepID=Q319R6_PROM9|nr:glycosyltransferase [Prochlorococcus marinus]ABB50379.1 Glycosyltransferase-like protein [Prochlorococcus marinus str. MIT 9312]KGF99973.1 hypothetical protein EU97_1107 [Prochlorococcus marinus str. MIT 9311]
MKNLIISANSLSFILDYKLQLISSLLKKDRDINLYVLIPDKTHEKYQEDNFLEFKSLVPDKNIFYCLKKGTSPLALINNIFWFINISRKLPQNGKCYFVSHTATINIALFFFSFIYKNKRNFVYRFFITGFGPSRIRKSLRSRLIGRVYIKIMQLSSQLNKNKVFVLNTQDRETIQDYKPFRKVYVIRESGLLLENLIKIYNMQIIKPPLEKLKIVYIGRFLLEKGVNDLPIISFYLNLAGIKHTITAYGKHDPSNSSSLTLDEIKKLETEDLKFKSSRPFQEVFKDSHIFLFPSAREGHPRFVLESMAYQCIPIVSPNPGLDVDVVHLFNGIVSSTSSPSSLAGSVIRLVKDEKLYNKIKHGCKIYTEEITKISTWRTNLEEIFSQ